MQKLIEDRAGQTGTPTTKPLGSNELIERFLAEHDVRSTSRRTYQAGLHRFFRWFESHSVAPVTEAHVIAFKSFIGTEGLSPFTISAYLTALKLFFRWAARIGICQDVSAGLKLPKLPKGFRKDPLSVEQVREVLAGIGRSTLAGKRDYALINLAVCCGLRTIELRRLDVGDIRMVDGQYRLQIQGKGRDCKDQSVPLEMPVLKPILDYLKARGATKDGEPIFASLADSNRGQRLTTFSISTICKKYIVRFAVNSRRLSAHSLRHTCATIATPANATFPEVESVQHFLRHESLATSMIYIHSEKSGNAAASRVATIIHGEPAEPADHCTDTGRESASSRAESEEGRLISLYRSLPKAEKQILQQSIETAYFISGTAKQA